MVCISARASGDEQPDTRQLIDSAWYGIGQLQQIEHCCQIEIWLRGWRQQNNGTSDVDYRALSHWVQVNTSRNWVLYNTTVHSESNHLNWAYMQVHSESNHLNWAYTQVHSESNHLTIFEFITANTESVCQYSAENIEWQHVKDVTVSCACTHTS